MNTSFSTVTLLSFYQWADNYLLNKQQAYINNVGPLYYQPDTSLPASLVAYASPFKSFVWDSGVSGANILESVSGSAGTIHRGQSGMMVDFVNGRVLLNAAVGTNATISGSYAFKELNLYFANQSQERMVFSDKYYLNSRFSRPATGIPPANDMVTPCVFITNATSTNDPWALGGLYNTKATFSLNVLAENLTQLEGTLQAFVDAKDTNFPQLPPSAWPLNNYGDYKSGHSGYNYQQVLAQYGAGNNVYSITDVRASKVSDYAKIDEAVFLGLLDITIERARTIR